MDDTKLSERLIPRRSSAKKAQQSFAEQLSTDDSDGGTTDGQGRSKTRRSRVSGKRKDAKRAKTMHHSASMEDVSAAASKGKGKARASSPAPAAESTSSPVLPSMSSAKTATSTRPRPRPLAKKPGATLPPLAVVTAPQVLGDEMSPLTSLSSFSEDGSLQAEIPEPLPKPPSKRQTSKLKAFPSFTSVSAPPIARGSTCAPNSSAGPSNAPVWTAPKMGSYVWVLVDTRTFRVHDPERRDGTSGNDKLWWPAKVSQQGPGNALDVFLFGKGRGKQHITNCSQDNVLSYLNTNDYHQPRFTIPKFDIPSSSVIDLTSPSPKKKPKIDRGALEQKWHDALEELKQERKAPKTTRREVKTNLLDEDDSDELPDVGNIFQSLFDARDTSKRMGKRKRRDSPGISGGEDSDAPASGPAEEVEDDWTPPEADEELELPGELVLARDRPSTSVDYWPAKLLEYIPPTNRKQAPKYRVTWLDDTQGVVERSWFYTMTEDGFGTCKIGQFQSSFSEVQKDTDDDDARGFAAPRSPSPQIADPSPSAADFTKLDIRVQFQYTKPVLAAILANEYRPTRRRHTQFMKGGAFRQVVVKDSMHRGRMDPGDVDMLLVYIKGWCLGDAARGAQGAEEDGAAAEHVEDAARERTPRLASPIPVDSLPSSPAEPPPSSLPPSRLEREGSVLSDTSHPGPADTMSVVTDPPDHLDDALNALTESVMENERNTTTQPAIEPLRFSKDFLSLSNLHREDYCLNIVLQEAVRQVLLWRAGHRTSVPLLSDEEEEDLYHRGEPLICERDWVTDITRYRNALQKTNEQRSAQARALGHNRTYSGSRLRKNVHIPNYQE